jgi:hypothetical protein
VPTAVYREMKNTFKNQQNFLKGLEFFNKKFLKKQGKNVTFLGTVEK